MLVYADFANYEYQIDDSWSNKHSYWYKLPLVFGQIRLCSRLEHVGQVSQQGSKIWTGGYKYMICSISFVMCLGPYQLYRGRNVIHWRNSYAPLFKIPLKMETNQGLIRTNLVIWSLGNYKFWIESKLYHWLISYLNIEKGKSLLQKKSVGKIIKNCV